MDLHKKYELGVNGGLISILELQLWTLTEQQGVSCTVGGSLSRGKVFWGKCYSLLLDCIVSFKQVLETANSTNRLHSPLEAKNGEGPMDHICGPIRLRVKSLTLSVSWQTRTKGFYHT